MEQILQLLMGYHWYHFIGLSYPVNIFFLYLSLADYENKKSNSYNSTGINHKIIEIKITWAQKLILNFAKDCR